MRLRRCVYAHGLIFHIGTQHATEFLLLVSCTCALRLLSPHHVLAGVCDQYCCTAQAAFLAQRIQSISIASSKIVCKEHSTCRPQRRLRTMRRQEEKFQRLSQHSPWSSWVLRGQHAREQGKRYGVSPYGITSW